MTEGMGIVNDQTEPRELSFSRHTIRVTADSLRRLMRDTLWTPKQVAEALGVTSGAVSGWLKGDSMPKLAQVAVEALERRLGRSVRPVVFIAVCPPDKLPAFESFAGAVGVELSKVKVGP